MDASSALADLERADLELSIDVPTIQIGGRIFKLVCPLYSIGAAAA